MLELPEELRRQARERVRLQYETIAQMQNVNLGIINRGHPPSLRYRSVDELVREWSTVAGEMARFAVGLGLITPAEEAQIVRDFHHAHPDMWREE